MEDTSEDTSEDNQGQDEKLPADSPAKAPSGTSEGTGTNSTGQRPLTFQPSVDDPVQLTNFLKGVHEQYLSNRDRIIEAMLSAQPEESRHQKRPPREAQKPPSREEQLQPPANPTNPAAKAPPRKRKAKTTTRPSRPNLQEAPPSRGRRRRRAGNNASLLRARNIDFLAPDPEAESPPNETEEERRRRKERINGRRKRAKKMIEIDFLNEQYHELKEDNARLKAENETFRERITMLKDLKQSGMLNEKQAPRPPAHGVPRGSLKQPSNDEDDRKPAAVPAQPSAPTITRPLYQYALPPAEMALRVTREMTLRGPHEEAKEAFAPPQFVGLQGQTDPAAALSVASLRGYASIPNQNRTNLTRVQGAMPFAQQQILSQPTMASLTSALFGQQQHQRQQLHLQQQALLNQHQLQQQQLARNMATANSIANAPGLQMQQVYQHLLAIQQQQQQLQQQLQQNLSQRAQPNQQPSSPHLGGHQHQSHQDPPPS